MYNYLEKFKIMEILSKIVDQQEVEAEVMQT